MIATPMNKYLYTNTLALSAFLICTLSACKKDEKVHTSTAVVLSGADPGLNTCGWIIRVNGQTGVTSPLNSFKPLNLEQQYQTDGMEVKITYTIPDMVAIKCGSNSTNLPGYTQINVLSIKLAN